MSELMGDLREAEFETVEWFVAQGMFQRSSREQASKNDCR
jgi:hypothetical protein